MPNLKNIKNFNSDLLSSIENHIDYDINILMENRDINMGGRKIPQFDESGVYTKIISTVKQTQRTYRNNILKWACAIAILITTLTNVTYLILTDSPETPTSLREIYASKGEKMVVLLTDGSRIWLNADSKLIYPENFTGDERNVKIEGEAYFEVNKNPNKPFIVNVGNMNIKVTGTSFNVCAYPTDNNITTTLNEGKIFIGNNSNPETLREMKPGQQAIFNKATASCIIKNNEHYQETSGWKEDQLSFRNTSLDDVLKVLSRRFNVSFNIKNKRVIDYTYNFSCTANDLSNILDIMSSITPLKYKKTGINKYDIN